MNKQRALMMLMLMSSAYIAGAWSHASGTQELSRVEIDNDRLIVRRNIHPPHSKTPVHSHEPGLVVYLTDVRERSTSPDGSNKIVTHRSGDVVWAEARTHALENLSDTPIEALEIELKSTRR